MWTCRWVPGSGRVGRSIPVRGIRWRERSSRTARWAASSGSSVGVASATRASRRRAAWRAPLERHDAPSSVLPVVDCEQIRTARSLFRSPRSQHPASRDATRFSNCHLRRRRRRRRRRHRESPRRSPRRDRHRHHTYTLESYTRRDLTAAGGYAIRLRNRWRGDREFILFNVAMTVSRCCLITRGLILSLFPCPDL